MGNARQGRGNSLGLASLNNSNGFGAMVVVFHCPVLGPGVSKQGKCWLGVNELDGGGMALDWLFFLSKACCP